MRHVARKGGQGASDLNQGPVSNEGKGGSPVRQWTSDDHVIVAEYQDSHHQLWRRSEVDAISLGPLIQRSDDLFNCKAALPLLPIRGVVTVARSM